MARSKTANKENEIVVTDPGAKPTKKVRARWNLTTDTILLSTLEDEKREGNQTDNAAWKAEAFTHAAEDLAGTETGANGTGGPAKTAKMCATRWGATLRDKSGWGWDDEGHHIVVEDDVWKGYIAAHPDVEKWRHKSFPLYDQMADLVDGGVATGGNSFVPGQTPRNTSFTLDVDNVIDPQLRGEGGVFRAPDIPAEEPIVWPATDDKEEEPISTQPQMNSKKRTRASSDSSPGSSAGSGKRQRTDGHGRKPSTGHAMMAVSESLKEVANALHDPGAPTSPQRKGAAIQVVQNLANLSRRNVIRVMQLIRSDTSVADTLLAITGDDLHEEFLLAEIDDQMVAN
ncbi:hypothetical protein C8R44DRAFT_887706 [Mycena epipterygia]|nr:hypothetical protein C8R44DRAFT_887706 [Mycena epipterygia]